MAGITLAQAEAQLARWLEADSAVAQGQSFTIEGRSVTKADARAITEKIRFWEGKVAQLSRAASGRSRTRYVVPE